MKTSRFFLVIGVTYTFVALAFGAQLFAQSSTPVVSEQLVRIHAEVPTGDVTALFARTVTVAGVTYRPPLETVAWNASEKTVTVGQRTLTYAEVMQFVVAIALQERVAQINPPPPAPAPEPPPSP
jgi:hypothetical protein